MITAVKTILNWVVCVKHCDKSLVHFAATWGGRSHDLTLQIKKVRLGEIKDLREAAAFRPGYDTQPDDDTSGAPLMPQVLGRHTRAQSPMGRPLGNHLCPGWVGRPWFPSSTLSALSFIVSVRMWRTPDTVRIVFLVLALQSWSAWVAASLYRVCGFLRWVKLDTHTHRGRMHLCTSCPFPFPQH